MCLAGRNALHIDLHMASGFIYWCDFSSTVASQNGIRRIKPDGSGFHGVVTSGIGHNGIRGIAVDWASGISMQALSRSLCLTENFDIQSKLDLLLNYFRILTAKL